MPRSSWYKNGIRFECQGSGRCCTSRGEYGYVYLSRTDRINMAKALELSLTDFTRTYCTKYDVNLHYLKSKGSNHCVFLENNKCSVYKGRPTQCRTWPFWPENMNAKIWKSEIVNFCPGIDKGNTYSQEQIDSILLEQELNEV